MAVGVLAKLNPDPGVVGAGLPNGAGDWAAAIGIENENPGVCAACNNGAAGAAAAIGFCPKIAVGAWIVGFTGVLLNVKGVDGAAIGDWGMVLAPNVKPDEALAGVPPITTDGA